MKHGIPEYTDLQNRDENESVLKEAKHACDRKSH